MDSREKAIWTAKNKKHTYFIDSETREKLKSSPWAHTPAQGGERGIGIGQIVAFTRMRLELEFRAH